MEGNPLNRNDLKRALAESCNCVVILANKTSQDPELEDYRNIMYTLSVK